MDVNVPNRLYPIIYRYLSTYSFYYMRDLEQQGDAQWCDESVATQGSI
jgi:hypothetical protein